MVKHFSTAGMPRAGLGVYPTVGKETYFLITISPIGAPIFEVASESDVTFVC